MAGDYFRSVYDPWGTLNASGVDTVAADSNSNLDPDYSNGAAYAASAGDAWLKYKSFFIGGLLLFALYTIFGFLRRGRL